MMRLTCPSCATVLHCPKMRGLSFACPECGRSLRLGNAGKSKKAAQAAPCSSPSHPAAVAVAPPPPMPAPSAVTMPAAPSVAADAGSTGPSRVVLAVAVGLVLATVGLAVWFALPSRPPTPTPTPIQETQTQTEPTQKQDKARPPVSGGQAGLEQPEEESLSAPVSRVEVREVVHLSAQGDAAFLRQYRFPANDYSALRPGWSNSNFLRRRLGFRQHWQEIQDFRIRCDDAANTLVVRWTVRGLARLNGDGLWEAALADEPGLRLLSHHDNEAILDGGERADFGPKSPLTRIVRVPRGSSDLRLLDSPPRLGYRLASASPAAAAAPTPPRFTLKSQPYLMASLAQVHAMPQFTTRWVARTVFETSSGQPLRNYVVRFRLDEYAPTWKEFSCPLVVPGQRVVDAYYPLLDLKKLVELTGDCQARLEVEYQYQQADGQVVRKSETRSVHLLSRNQTVATDLERGEQLDPQDETANFPHLFGALVTKDDPLMREMAGRISRRLDGVAPALNAVDAMRYLGGTFQFMSDHVRYLNSTSDVFGSTFSQTIMYGRDVLSKHTGTCIDLAILYATACRGVRLQPDLVLIPGHCFPAIALPAKVRIRVQDEMHGVVSSYETNYVPVETTLIGSSGVLRLNGRPAQRYHAFVETPGGLVEIGDASFTAALIVGQQKFSDVHNAATTRIVDVCVEQARGVRPLPFPPLRLKDIGIPEEEHAEKPRPQPTPEPKPKRNGRPPQGNGPGGSGPGGWFPPGNDAEQAPVLTGQWHSTGRLPEGSFYEWTLTLNKDGSYKSSLQRMKRLPNGGTMPQTEAYEGTYKMGEETLVFTPKSQGKQVCEYRCIRNHLYVTVAHFQYGKIRLDFVRLPDE